MFQDFEQPVHHQGVGIVYLLSGEPTYAAGQAAQIYFLNITLLPFSLTNQSIKAIRINNVPT